MTRGKRQIAPILRVIIGLAKIYQKMTLSRDIGNISSISNRATVRRTRGHASAAQDGRRGIRIGQ
ncbi:hypothetical protein FOB31_20540 [Burkholderia multivorans]|nr:hypothetical protein FOB31_20540 [Burkholderia multivorans]QET38027.1 hypothetical protein FOB30_10040 [Burkholderia multivorans]